MSDSAIAGTTPASTPGQSAIAPTQVDEAPFSMPEKFVGKSPEEIARAYLEVEKQHGKAAARLGTLDAYSKIGSPEQIQQVIDYARQVKAALDAGTLVPKGQEKPPTAAAKPDAKPWEADDWAFRSPAEQARAIADEVNRSAQELIEQRAAQYGKTIEGLAGRDAREKSILVKAIEAVRRNPSLSIEELLNDAAGLAQKTPEELIEMAFQSRLQTPESRSADIEKEVAKRVADEMQKRDAQKFTDFSRVTTPKAQLGRRKGVDGYAQREAESRQIFESLSKVGIDLLR